MPGAAGLAHGHGAVLDPVPALVVVEVVGLAVGDDEEQPSAPPLRRKPGRGVADAGAEAGVEARGQRGDARLDRSAHRLVEALGGGHIDTVALERAEGLHRHLIAAGVEPPGERGQRLALDVDHRAARHRAFGRARDVEQDRHREVAVHRPRLAPDPVRALARDGDADARAHRGVKVQLVPVAVAGGDDATRAHRLELAADGADAAAGGLVEGGGAGGGVGLAVQHAGVGGQIAARPRVPFGIGEDARQRLAVHVLGGEVEMQLEPRGRGLADLAEPQLVLIVQRLAGAVVVVILDPAVEVEELGPGEDRLELVQDQAVLALGGVGLTAAGADGLVGGLPGVFGRAVGLAGLDPVRRRGGARLDRDPEGHGAHGLVAAGGGQVCGVARVERGHQRGRAGGQRRRVAEQAADHRLDGGLVRGQRGLRAGGADQRAQLVIERHQPRRGLGHPRHRGPRGGERGEVAAQRVVVGRGRPRMGRERRHPEVERAVRLNRRQQREARRQAQDAGLKARLRQRLGLGPQPPPPAEPVPADPVGAGAELDRVIPAEAPEQHREAPRHLGQGDPRGLVRGHRVEARGPAVPQLADGLLRLPRLDLAPVQGCSHFVLPKYPGLLNARKTVRWTVFSEEGRGSGPGQSPGPAVQPKTATTRSARPRFTSASSVSGSIIAADTARLRSMPPAISVAA